MHRPVRQERGARHVARVLEDCEEDVEREDVWERDPEPRLEGEPDRLEDLFRQRVYVECRDRPEQDEVEGLDDVLLQHPADEEDDEQHRNEHPDQDRDAGHRAGEEAVESRPNTRPGRVDDVVGDGAGVVVPVRGDDLPG